MEGLLVAAELENSKYDLDGAWSVKSDLESADRSLADLQRDYPTDVEEARKWVKRALGATHTLIASVSSTTSTLAQERTTEELL